MRSLVVAMALGVSLLGCHETAPRGAQTGARDRHGVEYLCAPSAPVVDVPGRTVYTCPVEQYPCPHTSGEYGTTTCYRPSPHPSR